MRKQIITLLTVGLLSIAVKAQDPVFTQYFLMPETLNPGFSGYTETTYAGIIHRTQWPNLDLKINTQYGFINFWSDAMTSGYGISVLNQTESTNKYRLSQVNANYAYRVQLNRDWYFRPGIEVGYGMKSYGFQNLLLSDQINIGTGAINNSSIDPSLYSDNIKFLDISVGMVVHNDNAWMGVSLKHLNKPNISLTPGGQVALETFFSAAAGYKFYIDDYIDVRLFPYETYMMLSTNYMAQGAFNRLDLAASLIFDRFFLGTSLVTNPALNGDHNELVTSLNLFGGLQIDQLKFGLSYDINTTRIKSTGGVYELSLTYQFNLDRHCFGCPDY
ncbi:hypothetical protein KCTC52924_00834 [Arenibacter antarcticus]|uniref:PorP/SprF family type IX secretion system membrane protein n=1 Tax=Arenibacter antarcticus TaxID=2040469 RepID=A0ABW5VC24_9FLAO|nr:PorP/SprF family type IX secretion system membrane protein [Arenibacter sp. H213]MCM4167653.1 hypothetical protein [Arenibacter sp. H213]